jgi:hypothetical protein
LCQARSDHPVAAQQRRSSRSRCPAADYHDRHAASGHVDLIEGTPEYDILFRMLEPHELAAALGFSDVRAIAADAAPKQKPQPAAEEPRAATA